MNKSVFTFGIFLTAISSLHARSIMPAAIIYQYHNEVEVILNLGASELFDNLRVEATVSDDGDQKISTKKGKNILCRLYETTNTDNSRSWSKCMFVIEKDGSILPRSHLTRELPTATNYVSIGKTFTRNSVLLNIRANIGDGELDILSNRIENRNLTVVPALKSTGKNQVSIEFNQLGRAMKRQTSSMTGAMKTLSQAGTFSLNLERYSLEDSRIDIDYLGQWVTLRFYDPSRTCPPNARCLVGPIDNIQLPITSIEKGSCGVIIIKATHDARPADGNLEEITVTDAANFGHFCKSLVAVPATSIEYKVVTAGFGAPSQTASAHMTADLLKPHFAK